MQTASIAIEEWSALGREVVHGDALGQGKMESPVKVPAAHEGEAVQSRTKKFNAPS